MHLFVTLGGVCVVDVGLVNPEGVAQYKPVLVAGYRGERAAPPLEVVFRQEGLSKKSIVN